MKRNQTGLTMIGFVITLSVIGIFLYVGMKLFPMYSEYYSVKQALRSMAEEPGIGQQDSARIRELFFRRLNISYSENVKPEHITLTRNAEGGWTMTVNYELRKPMVANLDVVGKFHATQQLIKRGPDS